jgi:hypothetical protein
MQQPAIWSCARLYNTCLVSDGLAVLNTVQNRCHCQACCSRKVSDFTPVPLPLPVALNLPSLCKTFWKPSLSSFRRSKYNRFPNPIPASHEIHSHTELREHIYRDPSLWSTYAELQQQIYPYPRLWRRDLISQRLQPPSTHAKKLAAVIVVLSFVFCLWFGVPTYRPPVASYPYYDTQKPVPPWSEPMPLEGNYDRLETASARSSFP